MSFSRIMYKISGIILFAYCKLFAYILKSKKSNNHLLYCKIIDYKDLELLKSIKYILLAFDFKMFNRLRDKRLKGLRLWEYGILVNFLNSIANINNFFVLDIGSGNSMFPAYLTEKVQSVATIDYANPLEYQSETNKSKYKKFKIHQFNGSMLELPFRNNSFDLVTCISVIEHLDDLGAGSQLNYNDFIGKTKTGLMEMMRVIKKGGYLYLTTDVFIPEYHKGIDNWSVNRPPFNVIWSAYQFIEIENIFINVIIDNGFILVGETDYNASALLQKEHRSSFRGRYFTTFALLAQKKEY